MKIRIVTSGLLLLLTLVALVLAWSTWTVREARQTAISELQLATERGTAQIGHALRALELVMRTTSAHVVATETKEGLQPYLKQLTARLPPIRTVTVIGPDGVIRTDLRPGEPAKGYKVPDRAYFRAHFPPDAVADYFYSPPIKSRLDGLTQITLSLAARRGNGDLVAVVVSSIDDRFFSELSQELKTVGRYDARVLYKDGRDVYTLHEPAPAGAEHGVVVDTMARLFSGSKTFHRKQIAIPYTDLSFQLSLPVVSYMVQAVPRVVRGSLVIGLILLLLAIVLWLAYRGRVQIIESEKRFKDFAETTSDYFWEMDADLRFSYFSDHFEEITGITQATLLGKTREETGIPQVDSDIWEEHLADLNAHRGFDNFTHPRTHPNGQVVWLSISGNPFFDNEGHFLGYRGTGTDITERKNAEEVRERLSQAVENVSVGIALFDSDDRLVFFNKRYEEMMKVMADLLKPGLPFEEMVRTIVDRHPVKEAQGREEDFIRERIKHHRNPTGPMSLQREDEWLMVDDLRLPDGSIFTIFYDVTEQKQAEEDRRLALVRAEEANQAKSEFLATMSHELRTPLNAILGFADILYNQYLGPPGQGLYREYAGDIKASGEHLMTLVNEILDLSTIEAGKQSLDKVKLSTMEIVTECERIIEGRARSNGIDLVTEVPEGLPPLYADRRAFKQILLNLLSNAVKFTPQGGKITVSVKASKRNTILKIADTGKGIPTEKLPKLTDPFIRADTDPYLTEKGWGLGLTITKSLIELHDGTLDIKSKVGRGTTVTVTLPNEA